MKKLPVTKRAEVQVLNKILLVDLTIIEGVLVLYQLHPSTHLGLVNTFGHCLPNKSVICLSTKVESG